MRYLVSREGSEHGRLSVEQRTAFVADGSVRPDDWGPSEADARWVPVRE